MACRSCKYFKKNFPIEANVLTSSSSIILQFAEQSTYTHIRRRFTKLLGASFEKSVRFIRNVCLQIWINICNEIANISIIFLQIDRILF